MSTSNGDLAVRRVGLELGATGIRIFGGIHYNIEDYNLDLRNQKGMELFAKMRNDGEVSGVLSRITMPLLAADWHVEPNKDDPGGEEVAAFVEETLMRSSINWEDFIRQSLLMLTYGFMAFEKVWGVDSKGRQVYAKLAPRLPTTVWKFNFDERNELASLTQRVYTSKGYETPTIPVEKLVLFVFGREGDNYWGRSILRPAFGHWEYKQQIMWVDAASIERFGMGVLEMHATEQISDQDKEAAEAIAREFRSHERSYLFTGHNVTATFHYPPSGTSRAVDSIKYHDAQIGRSALQEWAQLGASESGSRSLGDTKVNFAMIALQGTAKVMESVFDVQIVPELVRRNFGSRSIPKVRIEDLDKMTGDQLANILKPLTEVRLIVPDKPIREHLRRVLDLPEEDEASQDLTPIQTNPFEKKPMPDPDAMSGSGTPQPKSDRVLHMADLTREPFPHERFSAFREMSTYLDDEPKRIWARTVAPIREDIVRALASKLSGMTDAELRSDVPRPLQKKLMQELYQPLLTVYRRGRAAILLERRRQLAGEPAGETVVRMAEPDDENGLAATTAQESWLRALAGKFALGLVGTMAVEGVRLSVNARNADLPKEEERRTIEQGLRDLSIPRQQVMLGGVVTQAFTNGRNEQAQALRSDVTSAFYSAIMDSGTCDNCAPFDGAEHEPENDVYATPNPACLGGDNCRCVTIYVFREEAA